MLRPYAGHIGGGMVYLCGFWSSPSKLLRFDVSQICWISHVIADCMKVKVKEPIAEGKVALHQAHYQVPLKILLLPVLLQWLTKLAWWRSCQVCSERQTYFLQSLHKNSDQPFLYAKPGLPTQHHSTNSTVYLVNCYEQLYLQSYHSLTSSPPVPVQVTVLQSQPWLAPNSLGSSQWGVWLCI